MSDAASGIMIMAAIAVLLCLRRRRIPAKRGPAKAAADPERWEQEYLCAFTSEERREQAAVLMACDVERRPQA